MKKKTINTMQLELYFVEKKIGSCCLMQIIVSPHHVEFSGVFLKLITIYMVYWIAGLQGLVTLHVRKKVKLEKKQ